MKLILLVLLALAIDVLNMSSLELNHYLVKKIEKLEKELNELKEWKENITNKHSKRYHIKSEILENKDHVDLLYNRL